MEQVLNRISRPSYNDVKTLIVSFREIPRTREPEAVSVLIEIAIELGFMSRNAHPFLNGSVEAQNSSHSPAKAKTEPLGSPLAAKRLISTQVQKEGSAHIRRRHRPGRAVFS
jgi:hypothetical protein